MVSRPRRSADDLDPRLLRELPLAHAGLCKPLAAQAGTASSCEAPVPRAVARVVVVRARGAAGACESPEVVPELEP